MVFDLREFRDLGKCSTGSMLDYWDTDKCTIHTDGDKVEIQKVQDLFPFLWRSAGISSGSADGTRNFFFFGKSGYWWDRYENDRQDRVIKYARRWIRQKGKDDIEGFLDSLFTNDEKSIGRIIFNTIAAKPYSRKKLEIPEDCKSDSYKQYMIRMKEIQQKLIEANK